ncbi:hypothetical protein F5B17DRAFT_445518 [Nemania serpens]|nr:hypothetical protein F5B17DRAFT_445518 [Nemania serpens]
MLLAAFLALCHTIVAAQSHVENAAADDTPSAMSLTASAISPILTQSGTVYVVAVSPTLSPSDAEMTLEKRRTPASNGDGHVEATIVVATVPPALSTILTPQNPSTQITALKDNTTAPTPGPSGAYGSGGGINPSTGSGSGAGSGPSSGGEPNLPSGAYGQPPNTAGQQPSSPAGQQSSYPSGQQSPNPQGQQPSNTEGQQSTSPTAGQSQNPSGGQTPNPAGGQSPNPAGQQFPSSTIKDPGVLITTVPLLGTVVETVTISLEYAPGSSPSSAPPTTEFLPTIFVTVQASSSSPSTPCESDPVPWGLLSAPENTTALPTTFAAVPGTGSPSPIPATTSTPDTITVMVPGSQEQPSTPAPNFTTPGTQGTIIVTVPGSQGQSSAPGTISATTGTPGSVIVTVPGSHGQSSTPNVPGSVTVSGTFVTVPSSLHSGPSTAGSQLYSSTCTTGLYTDIVSTATVSSTVTSASTLAVGSSAPSQHTTWSFATFVTATSTATPIPITSAGSMAIGLTLPVICSAIALAFITSITAMMY